MAHNEPLLFWHSVFADTSVQVDLMKLGYTLAQTTTITSLLSPGEKLKRRNVCIFSFQTFTVSDVAGFLVAFIAVSAADWLAGNLEAIYPQSVSRLFERLTQKFHSLSTNGYKPLYLPFIITNCGIWEEHPWRSPASLIWLNEMLGD